MLVQAQAKGVVAAVTLVGCRSNWPVARKLSKRKTVYQIFKLELCSYNLFAGLFLYSSLSLEGFSEQVTHQPEMDGLEMPKIPIFSR
ncbi:hypothetical protein [Pantoea sp. Cy-639]|uniref:hypothetical protein n=1 Tax=Pantoea sp. Cy-639 TaxID=2608360 RepID=UPI00142444CA|nr:hypothetical protein [Pantoea sp. Cy-639]